MNSIAINGELLEKLEEHAMRAYPEECCGILFKEAENTEESVIAEAAELTNRDSREISGRHFHIGPLELYQYEKAYREKGFEICGFYHSHPDKRALPSAEDEKEMLPGMVYLIISARKEDCPEIRAWKKENLDGKVKEIILEGNMKK